MILKKNFMKALIFRFVKGTASNSFFFYKPVSDDFQKKIFLLIINYISVKSVKMSLSVKAFHINHWKVMLFSAILNTPMFLRNLQCRGNFKIIVMTKKIRTRSINVIKKAFHLNINNDFESNEFKKKKTNKLVCKKQILFSFHFKENCVQPN